MDIAQVPVSASVKLDGAANSAINKIYVTIITVTTMVLAMLLQGTVTAKLDGLVTGVIFMTLVL